MSTVDLNDTTVPIFSGADGYVVGGIGSGNNSLSSNNSECCVHGPYDQTLVKFFSFWIEGVAIAFVGTFGLLGNLLSVSVLCGREMRTAFNQLLIVLAAIDSILIALAMLDYSFVRAFNLTFDLYNYMFPHFLYPTTNVVLCVSIFLVLAIAFERFLAVCHPYDYRIIASTQTVKRRVLKLTLPVFCFGLLINIPKFFETEVVEVSSASTNSTMVTYAVTDLRKNPTYINYYVNWFRLLGTGVVPMGALIFLNVNIYLKVAETRKTRLMANQEQQVRLQQQQHQHHNGFFMGGSGPATVDHMQYHQQNNGFLKPDDAGGQSHNNGFDQQQPQQLLSWQQQRQRRRQQEEELSRRDIRMASVLLTIVLVFFFCHLPRVLLNLHEFFMVRAMNACGDKFCPPVWFLCSISLSHLLLVINSSVNILIYCSVGEKFRQNLRRRLCCLRIATPIHGTIDLFSSACPVQNQLSGVNNNNTHSVVANGADNEALDQDRNAMMMMPLTSAGLATTSGVPAHVGQAEETEMVSLATASAQEGDENLSAASLSFTKAEEEED